MGREPNRTSSSLRRHHRREDCGVILYHFTTMTALRLMGDFDEADNFSLTHGLRPGEQSMSQWEHVIQPLRTPPKGVWFTSDQNADIFTSSAGIRITVALPSTDRRLAHWLTYVRKQNVFYEDAWPSVHARPAVKKFYVYFGDVPLSRIRAVEEAQITTDKLMREQLTLLDDREAA
jgi:hypothetical protein